MNDPVLLERGRAFDFPLYEREEDEVTPADWPAGVFTSELDWNGQLLATFQVDDTNRAAADGGVVVLRLTDAVTAAINVVDTFAYLDVRDADHRTVVPSIRVEIKDPVTE